MNFKGILSSLLILAISSSCQANGFGNLLAKMGPQLAAQAIEHQQQTNPGAAAALTVGLGALNAVQQHQQQQAVQQQQQQQQQPVQQAVQQQQPMQQIVNPVPSAPPPPVINAPPSPYNVPQANNVIPQPQQQQQFATQNPYAGYPGGPPPNQYVQPNTQGYVQPNTQGYVQSPTQYAQGYVAPVGYQPQQPQQQPPLRTY